MNVVAGEQRRRIVRAANVVRVLARAGVAVSADAIVAGVAAASAMATRAADERATPLDVLAHATTRDAVLAAALGARR